MLVDTDSTLWMLVVTKMQVYTHNRNLDNDLNGWIYILSYYNYRWDIQKHFLLVPYTKTLACFNAHLSTKCWKKCDTEGTYLHCWLTCPKLQPFWYDMKVNEYLTITGHNLELTPEYLSGLCNTKNNIPAAENRQYW